MVFNSYQAERRAAQGARRPRFSSSRFPLLKEHVMQVQPYLYFDGRTEEALKFYEAKLGARIEAMMRFSDAPPGAMSGEGCPGGVPPPADKVMHANFRIGDTQI